MSSSPPQTIPEKPVNSTISSLRLLAIILLILLPPVLVGGIPDKVYFDDTHIKQLTTLHPDYVFIGSSILLSRIDVNHLSKIRPGETGYILGDVGSLSSLWYLWLKNSLISSQIKPKTVFIVFRENALTNPEDETSSLVNKKKILQNSLQEEPVFDHILNHHKTVVDQVREQLNVVYSIQETWRKKGYWLVDSLGFLFSIPGYLEYKWNNLLHPEQATEAKAKEFFVTRFNFKTRMNKEIFHPNNQRVVKNKTTNSNVSNERYNFNERVMHSFLPEIIRLGKEASLKLVFIRTQTMPNTDGTPHIPTPEFSRYLQDLSEYLKKEGVGFHDFTGDPSIQWTFYLDGGHIAPKYKKFYTEHFVQTLQEYFQ